MRIERDIKMKRILKSLVAGAALALILSPSARADALMRIAVGGGQ